MNSNSILYGIHRFYVWAAVKIPREAQHTIYLRKECAMDKEEGNGKIPIEIGRTRFRAYSRRVVSII